MRIVASLSICFILAQSSINSHDTNHLSIVPHSFLGMDRVNGRADLAITGSVEIACVIWLAVGFSSFCFGAKRMDWMGLGEESLVFHA